VAIVLCATLAIVAGEMTAATTAEVPEDNFLEAPPSPVIAAAAANEAKLKAAVVAAKAQAAAAKLAAAQASQQMNKMQHDLSKHQGAKAPTTSLASAWDTEPAQPTSGGDMLASIWGEGLPKEAVDTELLEEEVAPPVTPEAAAANEAKIKAQLLKAKAAAASAKLAAMKAAGDVRHVQTRIKKHKQVSAAQKAKAALAKTWGAAPASPKADKASKFMANVWGEKPVAKKNEEYAHLPVPMEQIY
jgi:histone H1/5